jgi:NADH dehydrogenase/NADH:ubiquinone oxidoreductase subunit G
MPNTETQETKAITLTIDGQPIAVPEGTTIWDAARELGITIPVLCHDPRLAPVAVCRVCVVEVKGARVAQASCIRQVEAGMEVQTQSEKIERSRKMLAELLLADHPIPCVKHQKNGDCELELLGERYGLLHVPSSRGKAGQRELSSAGVGRWAR